MLLPREEHHIFSSLRLELFCGSIGLRFSLVQHSVSRDRTPSPVERHCASAQTGIPPVLRLRREPLFLSETVLEWAIFEQERVDFLSAIVLAL